LNSPLAHKPAGYCLSDDIMTKQPLLRAHVQGHAAIVVVAVAPAVGWVCVSSAYSTGGFAVDAGLHGSGRDAEDLRCFINRLLVIVNEVDNLPMSLCGDLEKIYFPPPFCHGMGIAQPKSGLSL
jgi:hypothetical protein